MPVTSKSARVPASAKPATKIAPRLVGQALNLRAEGQSRVMIAWKVRLPVKVVTDLLRSARMAGDARALTDAEAQAVVDGYFVPVASVSAKLVIAESKAPVPSSPVRMVLCDEVDRFDDPPVIATLALIEGRTIVPAARRTVIEFVAPQGSLDPGRLCPADRLHVVDELHSRADRAGGQVGEGLRHMADLYLHCPTFYPSVRVASDGLPVRVMPPEVSGSFGNAGLACAMA